MKQIKAIVTSSSALNGVYFGHTFEVCDIHPLGRVSLKINNVTVDFNFTEVMIVNYAEIVQKLYDDKNWGSTTYTFSKMPSSPKVLDLYNALTNYAATKKILISPIYNCPA